MSTITWLPVSLVALFWAFGTVRLAVGLAVAKRQNVEQRGYAKVYGDRLAEHHEQRVSCAEAITPLRERRNALAAQVAEQHITIRGLVEENKTLKATLDAAKQPADSGATS
jgi:seryl-tRNA synthetase